jgi:hypothetical protein
MNYTEQFSIVILALHLVIPEQPPAVHAMSLK